MRREPGLAGRNRPPSTGAYTASMPSIRSMHCRPIDSGAAVLRRIAVCKRRTGSEPQCSFPCGAIRYRYCALRRIANRA
ncbi:hypothetical protein D779_2114 [Imhoffiella purpurea]|uniref:Uncharacterized protein n=1 Tax=Imhoffiella purpurea TaxID=1249627 RepID=W9V5V2_9GAMM|nr:hypothetical protein D779_2114 [Imhoffiella purpurea]